MVAIGINEENLGIAKLAGTSTKLVFPPSYAAEAAFARSSRAYIKSTLEQCVEASAHDGFSDSFPTLARWIKEKGELAFADLESRVRDHHEGMAHLIKSAPVRENHRSTANVDYSIIRRRGDGRKGNERSRSTNIFLDRAGNVEDYNCTCPQFKTEFVRGKFNDEGPLVHAACYHVNVALQEKGLSPYVFDNPLAILESIAMKVFRKTSKKTFERDKYLLTNPSILTDSTRRGIANGSLSVEVIWHQKNIRGRAWGIINDTKRHFEGMGYEFAGFSLDFPNTPYETTSLTLVKKDGSGRSIHLLYDDNLGIGELPLFMLQIPVPTWIAEGRPVDFQEPSGNPALYSAGQRYFRNFDMRTQAETVAIIASPNLPLLLNANEKTLYKQALQPITA